MFQKIAGLFSSNEVQSANIEPSMPVAITQWLDRSEIVETDFLTELERKDAQWTQDRQSAEAFIKKGYAQAMECYAMSIRTNATLNNPAQLMARLEKAQSFVLDQADIVYGRRVVEVSLFALQLKDPRTSVYFQF